MGHAKSKHKKNNGFGHKLLAFGRKASGFVEKVAPTAGVVLSSIFGPEAGAMGDAIGRTAGTLGGLMGNHRQPVVNAMPPAATAALQRAYDRPLPKQDSISSPAQYFPKKSRKRKKPQGMGSDFIRHNHGKSRQLMQNKDIVRHSAGYLTNHTELGSVVKHSFARAF